MCSLVLKEALEYYNSNRGTVYCVMLDASKAFDRVQYCKLFRKLLSRQMPAVIVRYGPKCAVLLWTFWYKYYDAVTLVKERKLLADEEMIWRAYMVMVRDGVCCLSSDEFFRDDVLALIFNLSVSWFFFFFMYLLYGVCVYFEYDLQ